MKLHDLGKIKSNKKMKRIGRGYGSGKGGHTVGRGIKGQKSRTGFKPPMRGFEGGQMPLHRRLPKVKGFKRGMFKKDTLEFTLTDLNTLKDGTVLNFEYLEKEGYFAKAKPQKVKILGNGKLEKKVKVEGIATTKTAKAAIEKAGGSVK
ncbi:50S ribosomal protein L15 [Candidatus Dojkabacteria bacterium]|uniref:Large ribosomal subunit protein uL15 n=1 Tax=Candidatus Dojkabacteria bacterium TaxID=2099670 RepID=A0A955RI08_9BACT|nr:50S ribosomal protein L15 [Candidatus Dojkabacteria bacterium]